MTKLLPILVNTLPMQVTGDSTLFKHLTVFGYKGFTASGVPLNNSAPVYLGLASGESPFAIATGASLSYNVQPNSLSLSNLWLQGAGSNDGAYIIAV